MAPKLLIGPLFNPRFLGDYHRHPQIKLFMPESAYTQNYGYDLVYSWQDLTDFGQILEKLPANWEPDLIIWWDVLYQGIPPGIENCPYPIALIPGDWNLGYLTTRHFAEVFDLVLADIHLKHCLEAEGLQHIVHWPGFSFDPEELYLEPEQTQIYDISFIGNLNEAIHPRRSQILDQALSLSDRYQVLVRQGIWGAEYRQILNQSKIVLNYTIAQVMNLRGYEAPACGALLFIEAENLEIAHFLKDREECVYYRADNLTELLCYYLENEDKRARIAKAGYQKIQAFSYQKQFALLLKQLPKWLNIAQKRRTERLTGRLNAGPSQSVQNKLKGLSQFFCSQPEAQPSALKLVTQALEKLQTQPHEPALLWQLNALACLLFPLGPAPPHDPTLQLVKRCFEQGLKLAPHNPVFHYHLALCLESGQETYLALQHYSRCVELLAESEREVLWEYREFILPFFRSRGRELLAIEWERASFETQADLPQLQIRYMRLLMCQIWQRLGALLEKAGNLEKAQTAYQNALSNFADPKLYLHLARLCNFNNQEAEAWQYFKTGLAQEPFLISQIGSLFSPSLFLHHRDEIQQRSQRYADVFNEVKASLALCQLLDLLENPAAKISEVKTRLSLLAKTRPETLEKFKQILEFGWAQPFEILNPLRKISALAWENPLEEAPPLKLSASFIWSKTPEQAQFLFSFSANSSEIYHRTLSQKTDLSQRQIGVDQWPLHFPTPEAVPLAPELEEWLNGCDTLFLALTETLSEPEKISLLKNFESDFGEAPRTGLLLYAPQSSGSLCLLCENQIEKSNVSIIDESLNLAEWAALFKRVTGLIVTPQAEGLFYAAWALWLGIPLYLSTLPEVSLWPGSEYWQFKQWLSIGEHPQCLTFHQKTHQEFKKTAEATALRLHKIYQQEAEDVVLKLLWQLRLQVLGLWVSEPTAKPDP
ncbi:MAG: glycosyltransferase [Candidatus Sericytochromatia bacterium]